MKFDEMKPAPPVTRTRLLTQSSSSIVYSGLPSTSRWILPSYSPISARTNPCMPSTSTMPAPAKSGPGKFAVDDPVDDAVDAERGRGERADDAERDADPLHRLRPEAGDDVQREPDEAERRVARAGLAARVRDVDLLDRHAAREDERLRELLPADRAEHRLDRRRGGSR